MSDSMVVVKKSVNVRLAYIATLRCQAWCYWPESQTFRSNGYEDPTLSSPDHPVYVVVEIVTYPATDRAEKGPRKPQPAGKGPRFPTMDKRYGFWLGETFVIEQGTVDNAKLSSRPLHEGEIDINVCIYSDNQNCLDHIPEERIKDICDLICKSATVFMNLMLGELAVPVHPLWVRKVKPEGSAGSLHHIPILAYPRNTVSHDQAQATVNTFTGARMHLTPEKALSLSVAATRYLNSLTETDSIDRYCDLWESFEFSSFGKKGEARKKNADILSKHLSNASRTFNAHDIKKALKLDDLWNTRCDIVHRAVEHPTDFREKLYLLEVIAKELLNHHYQLPYNEEFSGLIEKYLSEIKAR